MRAFTIHASDIARCPTHRMDVAHYREDGTCLCVTPVTDTLVCEWFALCTNPADGVVNHPVLGDVPTCQRCADKLDLDLVTP